MVGSYGNWSKHFQDLLDCFDLYTHTNIYVCIYICIYVYMCVCKCIFNSAGSQLQQVLSSNFIIE